METKKFPKGLKLLFFFLLLLLSIAFTNVLSFVISLVLELVGLADVNPYLVEMIALCLAFSYWYADTVAEKTMSIRTSKPSGRQKKSE